MSQLVNMPVYLVGIIARYFGVKQDDKRLKLLLSSVRISQTAWIRGGATVSLSTA